MDETTLYTLMVDLHRDGARQGPGSEEDTLRALDLTRLDRGAALRVADIGCGTGASTLTLARHLPEARITAVDLFPEFLELLAERARGAGVSARIETLAESMESLPFAAGSLDLVWAEGAIYNMGFAAGLRAWRDFLRPGGVLAVSEISWLRPDPPDDLRTYWESEYAEIATVPDKITVLQAAGYDLLGAFVIPSASWIDAYYAPTEARIPAFLERHAGRPEAAEVVEMERREAALYDRWRDWFGYGFYVASKR